MMGMAGQEGVKSMEVNLEEILVKEVDSVVKLLCWDIVFVKLNFVNYKLSELQLCKLQNFNKN